MKKILDFLIIFLLAFLVINLLSSKDEAKGEPKLKFQVSDSSYSVPASVVLKIENWDEKLNINSCRDIEIRFSWEKLSFPEDFCEDIELAPKEKFSLDYSVHYDKFIEIGNYAFEINTWWKKYVESFEIDHKWAISKIFISLFYAPIYNLMVFLISICSYSMWRAIVCITVILRVILLYPQHKMMLSQKKLQSIQPKIKKIQNQYKWNSQTLWLKLMELYKKEKVNPLWSCGFLLIQMPILIVIYNVILYIRDSSNYYYVYEVLSWFDIENITYNFFWLDLLWAWWISWIILWLSVWLIQYIQVKLSLPKPVAEKDKVVLEKKKWKSDYEQFMPDPELINKFMLYGMPVMVAIFTYTLIAWVWIYWWISTLFMIFQQIFVNKILKKSS